jgi:hypothetical protein
MYRSQRPHKRDVDGGRQDPDRSWPPRHRWKGPGRGARVDHNQGVIMFVAGFGPNFSKRRWRLFTRRRGCQADSSFVEGYGGSTNGPPNYTFPALGKETPKPIRR